MKVPSHYLPYPPLEKQVGIGILSFSHHSKLCLTIRTNQYLTIPPVNLPQKYSHFMRKRKNLPGI